MVAMQPFGDARYTKRYDDPGVGWFTVVVDSDHMLLVEIHGKGSMPGTRALLAMFDEIASMREGDEILDVLMDLSGLTKTPLRAQAVMAKWLLANRSLVGRVGICGAKPWERRMAKAVLKLARFDRAALFKTRGEAARWLRPERDA